MNKQLRILLCLLLAGIGGIISGFAQSDSKAAGEAKQAKEAKQRKDFFDRLEYKARTFNHVGAEAAMIKLRPGYENNSLWTGYQADIAGVVTVGHLRGQATYQDSAGTVHMDGSHTYGGGQFCYPLFKNQIFDIYPMWGIGVQYNRMQNGRLYNSQDENHQIETAGLGGYLSVGLGVMFGPVSVKVKVTGIATANFNRANAVEPFQYYPSVTVGIKPLKLLLNPYMFTADGIRHSSGITDIQNVQNYRGETVAINYTVKTTVTEGSATVMDVRPYWFLGPTFTGSLNPQRAQGNRMTGIVGGFRYGSIYMDGSYAGGGVPFGDLLKHDGFLKPNEANYAAPRMDGYFGNSTRYGGRFGVDLITWFQKSNFIANTGAQGRKLRQATSYYALIPSAGYGIMNLGAAVFNDPAGKAYYQAYTSKNGFDGFNVLQRQNQRIPYFTLGGMFILGAISADFNVYFVQPSGEKTRALTREMSIAWKLPVVRLFRIGRVLKMQKAQN